MSVVVIVPPRKEKRYFGRSRYRAASTSFNIIQILRLQLINILEEFFVGADIITAVHRYLAEISLATLFGNLIDDTRHCLPVLGIECPTNNIKLLNGLRFGTYASITRIGIGHRNTINHIENFTQTTAPKMTLHNTCLEVNQSANV